ncbi:MAG: hypothetical protein ACI80F_001950 [Natronomonas sp.]|jgi:hypothetical protein
MAGVQPVHTHPAHMITRAVTIEDRNQQTARGYDNQPKCRNTSILETFCRMRVLGASNPGFHGVG